VINKELIINPEWEHAQFVSIAELKECEQKLEAANARIERLEEAGDALYEAWIGYGFTKDNHLTAWRKAKEAK
jgi:hypothetical protein